MGGGGGGCPVHCFLTYSHILDDVLDMLRGTCLVKEYLKQDYHQSTVHLLDQHLWKAGACIL